MASLPTVDKPPSVMPAEHRKTLFDAKGHPPAATGRSLESYAQKCDAINKDWRLTEVAKQAAIAELRDAELRDFHAAHQKHCETVLRPLSTEEGRLRASLKNEPPALDLVASDNDRARLIIQQNHRAEIQRAIDLNLRELDAATDLAEVVDIFEEAAAVSGETMRHVGRHAVRRAEAHLKAKRAAMPGERTADAMASPDARLVANIRERYAVWVKANPTTAQRLRQVLEKKAILEDQLASQGVMWPKAFGLM